MTQENNEMIKRAIDTHISALHRNMNAYIKGGNQIAARNCQQKINKYYNIYKTLNR